MIAIPRGDAGVASPRFAAVGRATHSIQTSLCGRLRQQELPESEPSPSGHAVALADRPAHLNSTAGNRHPRQTRGQPQGASVCLSGSAGISGPRAYLSSALAFALIFNPTAIPIITVAFHFTV